MGDDLGDDDDYLTSHIRGESDNDEASAGGNKTTKRKRKDEDDTIDNNTDDEEDVVSSQKRESGAGAAPPIKKQQVLLESSRNILELGPQEQATFLSAALSHYTRMSVDNENEEDSTNNNSSSKKPIPSVKRLAKFFAQPKGSSTAATAMTETNSFLDRLLLVCSKKRLKRHSTSKQTTGSPSVVIVCQSARRAVALLKECAPLGVQALKLFPKQAPLNQQAQECQQSTAALAVGTPHRLLALLQPPPTGGGSGTAPALKLDHTHLLVLDAATSNKNFTVCTLPDTAQDCMKLLENYFLPELGRRKDIKLAFC